MILFLDATLFLISLLHATFHIPGFLSYGYYYHYLLILESLSFTVCAL